MASIAKVIEVLSDGDSVEDAVQNAVTEASETVRDIKHIYVKEIQAYVENNNVTRYRVNVKVTFDVKGR